MFDDSVVICCDQGVLALVSNFQSRREMCNTCEFLGDRQSWVKNHLFNHVKSDTICGSLTPCIIDDTHVTQTYLYVMVCDVRQPHAIKRRYTTLLAVCASVSVVYINCPGTSLWICVRMPKNSQDLLIIMPFLDMLLVGGLTLIIIILPFKASRSLPYCGTRQAVFADVHVAQQYSFSRWQVVREGSPVCL